LPIGKGSEKERSNISFIKGPEGKRGAVGYRQPISLQEEVMWA